MRRDWRRVRDAGFGEAVQLARSGADPDDLAAALPPQAAHTVALVGDSATVRARVGAYVESGVDEIPAPETRPENGR